MANNIGRTFTIDKNWFESSVRPPIYRRSIIGLIVIFLSIFWWWQTKSWVPLALIAIVVIERSLEFVNIDKTKKYISSFRATINSEGVLIVIGDRSQLYPWGSLKFTLKKNKNGRVETIQLIDKANKFSKIKISGVKDIEGMASIILEKCNVP